MPSSFHLLEVCLLALSGIALVIALRRAEPLESPALDVAGLLAIAFFGTYFAKLLLLPGTKYPAEAPLRALYLTLLAIHAASASIGLGLGAATFVFRKNGKTALAAKWLRWAAPLWIVSAFSGISSALLLWSAIYDHGTPARTVAG